MPQPAKTRETARPLDDVTVFPLRDCILIDPYFPKHHGKLHLISPSPEFATKRMGKVLAIGPGRVNDSGVLIPISDVAVGDYVTYDAMAEAQITEGDRIKLRFIRHKDIVARHDGFVPDAAWGTEKA